MTAGQLALDCDPNWTNPNETILALLHESLTKYGGDLWGQGLTYWQIHTMQTVELAGDLL